MIQHISADPSLGVFLPESEGADIHESVLPKEVKTVIVKNFPNSFLKTYLEIKLRDNGVTKVIVIGMMCRQNRFTTHSLYL
ncbi:isochorismatase family protein [Jeotgalicoccus nanhaiensis]|uniref:isochorismatase family protein n=1 Tax=Jeotgalicoccus nanhaiensis TaxID=568603 RepID=UPI00296E46C9|nr:isochorismatase family protein [Jeotgalicoccus nanhaiensis]